MIGAGPAANKESPAIDGPIAQRPAARPHGRVGPGASRREPVGPVLVSAIRSGLAAAGRRRTVDGAQQPGVVVARSRPAELVSAGVEGRRSLRVDRQRDTRRLRCPGARVDDDRHADHGGTCGNAPRCRRSGGRGPGVCCRGEGHCPTGNGECCAEDSEPQSSDRTLLDARHRRHVRRPATVRHTTGCDRRAFDFRAAAFRTVLGRWLM